MMHKWSYTKSSQKLFQHSKDEIIKYFADPSKSIYCTVNINSKETFSIIYNDVMPIFKPQNNRVNVLQSNWMK